MRTFSFLILFNLVFPSILFSTAIHVPGDHATIQGAIDASVNGDVVLVSPGTYVEEINFLGKAITVKSSDGPGHTMIDGSYGLSSVAKFINGENLDSILSGFTICKGNGYASGDTYYGGGICCIDSSPTITNNIIRDNSLSVFNPSIYTYRGAGIGCKNSSPMIINNIICNNDISEQHNGSARGGGIYCEGSAVIANNIIYHNDAGTFNGIGGGVDCEGASILLNNMIYENRAVATGGISCAGSMKIINNTICNNASYYYGGGISLGKGDPEIINTIVRGNTIDQISYSSPSAPTVNFCNVQGGFTGTANIDADPLFVHAAIGDFHLTYPSPCRDTGDNTTVTELNDFEGDPRIAWGGTVDMGADEFYTHLYITGSKTPGDAIDGKLVGLPGTSPVGLFISAETLSSPISTMWGAFWLQPPWFLFGPLGAIPADGVMVLSTILPGGMTVPVDIPMQALIGLSAESLTNLYLLEVR